MKLRNYIIGIIALCLFVPANAKAESVSINCDKTTVVANSTFSCTIKGNSNENITGVSAKVELSSGLSLISANVDRDVWMGDGTNGKYDLAAEAYPYPTKSFTIGIINIKAGNTASNEIITVKNVDFINDNFDTNSVSDASATIKIETKKEEINTNKESSSNLNSNTQTNTSNSSTSLNNNASTNTNKSNSTSPNKNTPTKSPNNYLKNLVVTESPIVFDKKKNKYSIAVPYEIEKLTVNAEVEDAKSTVVITGNETLVVGTNIISIIVTAENGKTREYKIDVERKDENLVLSSDSSLSKITIGGYEIGFKNNVYDYHLKIKKTNSLKISAKTNDDNAKVIITGNENLTTGSVITITVTAEDGTTSIYKINIEEQLSYTWMIISILEAIILIITYVILILRKIISIKKHKARI